MLSAELQDVLDAGMAPASAVSPRNNLSDCFAPGVHWGSAFRAAQRQVRAAICVPATATTSAHQCGYDGLNGAPIRESGFESAHGNPCASRGAASFTRSRTISAADWRLATKFTDSPAHSGIAAMLPVVSTVGVSTCQRSTGLLRRGSK